jgi:hypothetical protein
MPAVVRRASRSFRPSLAEVLEVRMAMSHSGLPGGMSAHMVAGPIPAQAAPSVLSQGTYASVMAQIDAAFGASPHGATSGAGESVEQLSSAIHRLPLGASLWANVLSTAGSVAGSTSSLSPTHILDRVKREVRTFVRENLHAGTIVWQGPDGSLVHTFAFTDRMLPLPPPFRGPVPANPPTSMTPFLAASGRPTI